MGNYKQFDFSINCLEIVRFKKTSNNLDKKSYFLYHNTVEEELRILSIKLNKLSKSYKKLKEDNDRLKADVGYLRADAENHKDRLVENKVLNDKQVRVIKKLESLLQKISKSE
ncbi:MAG: hypothetical protein PHR82_01545 [Endomicrobiaceae bacterium]|nr:hypothetical protein [Endomicrobiaceae bacterium]